MQLKERSCKSGIAFSFVLSRALMPRLQMVKPWRRRMGQLALRKFGHMGASVVQFLGVTTYLLIGMLPPAYF